MKALEKKQPQALSFLFLTEMWERYGFYTVQGLLILYMTKFFGFSDDKGYAILGAFTALAYIAPILGGFIADHILGFRYTILLGNIFLAVGYGLLAYPGQTFFYIALALIVVGAGLFKPNISSLLGTLYESDDTRREGGFTIFYMGINLGIILATSTSGFVVAKWGWHSSFALASLGLVIGFIVFLVGMRRLGKHGLPPAQKEINKSPTLKFFANRWGLAIILLLIFLASWALIDHNKIANVLLWTVCGLLAIVLLYIASRYPKLERQKFIALLLLIASSIIFWGVFFQMFFSLNLFIDRDVQRQIFGMQIPTVMFIGLESVFIFLLGPIFVYLWRKLAEKNHNPSTALKFALGNIFVGISFLWLIVGIHSNSGLVNPIWIVLAYLFVTIGELLLSPIGLSTVTVLSPRNLVGMMMGVWFIALGLGGKLAGVIAQQASIPQGITDPKIEMSFYSYAFTHYAFYAIVTGIILLMLTPILKRMAQEK